MVHGKYQTYFQYVHCTVVTRLCHLKWYKTNGGDVLIITRYTILDRMLDVNLTS